MTVPIPNKSALTMNVNYVGPKRLIDEVFHRRGKGPSRPVADLRRVNTDRI